MINFIKKISIFAAIVVFFMLLVEFVIERIPNSINFKYELLKNKSKDAQVLILGSSHADLGIDPSIFKCKSYNIAVSGQGFAVDHYLLKKYIAGCEKLKCVILPVSYQSFTSAFAYGGGEIREMYSYVYSDYMNRPWFLKTSYEFFYFKSVKNKFIDYYLKGKSLVFCDSLGHGISITQNRKENWDDGKWLAKVYSDSPDWSLVVENYHYLNNIAQLCNSKRVKLILVTLPVYKSFYENLNRKQLNLMYSQISKIKATHMNVFYFDMLNDKRFVETDFYDGSHLSSDIGAKKYTNILNDTINKTVSFLR